MGKLEIAKCDIKLGREKKIPYAFTELEKLERRVIKHDQDTKVVFGYLKELLNPKTAPMPKIGFKRKEED